MGTPKGTKPWNAGKSKGWIDPRGYRIVSRTINGKRHQIREHRLIMETYLNRKLEPWEVVHHKDGNQLNNALENLEIMDCGEHTAKHHIGTRKGYDEKRTMELFANMREELKRERAIKSDLLAALEIAEGRLMCIDAQKLDTVARNDDVIDRIRAAIAKAKGE